MRDGCARECEKQVGLARLVGCRWATQRLLGPLLVWTLRPSPVWGSVQSDTRPQRAWRYQRRLRRQGLRVAPVLAGTISPPNARTWLPGTSRERLKLDYRLQSARSGDQPWCLNLRQAVVRSGRFGDAPQSVVQPNVLRTESVEPHQPPDLSCGLLAQGYELLVQAHALFVKLKELGFKLF